MYAAKARWSPDGTQLAFIGIIRGQFWQVFVVPSGGGTVRQVTTDKHERVTGLNELYRLELGVGQGWVGLAPDDTPLALRDVSTYDIYALDLSLP